MHWRISRAIVFFSTTLYRSVIVTVHVFLDVKFNKIKWKKITAKYVWCNIFQSTIWSHYSTVRNGPYIFLSIHIVRLKSKWNEEKIRNLKMQNRIMQGESVTAIRMRFKIYFIEVFQKNYFWIFLIIICLCVVAVNEPT